MKHIKILSFLIITILFSSCEKRIHVSEFEQDKYGRLSGPYYSDKEIKKDRLMLKGEYFTGTVFDNYSEDKLKFEIQFKKGLKNGIGKRYYDNGQLLGQVNYKEDELDGFSELYYENGQLKVKDNYKEGELDGPYEEYLENGRSKVKKNYKEGELDGPFEEYYENGQLKLKYIVKNGEEDGPFEEYYENGQLKLKYTWKNDGFDGLYIEYYENGQLKEKEKGVYKNGKFDGTIFKYSVKGELLEKLSYKNNKKNGVCEFYKDGKLYRKGLFENGRLVGDYEYNLINVDIPETDNNDLSTVPGKYPQSSTTQLKQNELTNMSKNELQIMRNEIFGRHGYKFKEGGKMDEYFSKQNWYNPQFSNVDSKLTPIEKSNIELIVSEEKKRE